MLNQSTNTNRLYQLLENSVDQFGYELVHLELLGRDNARILRLYIDAPGGVALDDCAFVSEQVGSILDVEDPISGHYSLEVSSPGIERPLVKKEHFEKALGQNVSVKTHIKCNGQRNFLGQLTEVSDHSIVVVINGDEHGIELANIDRARLKPGIKE